LQDCIDVKCGIDHTVALFKNGTVRAWGCSEATSVPPGLTGVKQIDVGWGWIIALKRDGTIAAWGANDCGQVSSLPSGSGFTKVSAGNMHGAAIRSGRVVCWGRNDFGQCDVPAVVASAPRVLDVVASGHATSALLADGTVKVWGAGASAVSASLTGVKAIAFSGSNLIALKTDGTVLASGSDDGISNVPAGLSDVTRVFTIGYSAVAVKRDGSIVSWGQIDSASNWTNGTIGLLPTLPTGFTWTTLAGKWNHAYGVVTRSNADSDGDGFTDFQEFGLGTDLYDPSSHP
jgi:alpha-tubulin suppressor-like RCC1 family protein